MESSRATTPVQIVGMLGLVWIGVYWTRSPGGDGAIAERGESRAQGVVHVPLQRERGSAKAVDIQIEHRPSGRGQRASTRSALPGLAGEVSEDRIPIRTYVVQRGDSLGEIAIRIYGSVRYADLIFGANGDLLTSPDDLDLGMVLRLPERPD